MKDRERFTLALDHELSRMVEERIQATGLSKGEVIRSALREYFRVQGQAAAQDTGQDTGQDS